MPIGITVPDGDKIEGVANGQPGVPNGREAELAWVLQEISRRRVRNTVWLTADVHYAAAHYYDPKSAIFKDFSPFWEFVAGPLHAGTFGPNTLDATFGPEAKFVGVPKGMKGNRPPSDGYQFFGTLKIDARSRVMTAGLHNLKGDRIYPVELPPER